MAQPATAAIVVAMIFVAAFVLFFGYKGYKKYHYHKQRKAMQAELPPIREPPSNYFLANGATSAGGSPLSPPSTVGTLYGDTWGRNSWRGSTSKASLGARGYSDMGGSRRMSSSGLLGSPGAEAAFGGSQNGAAADGSAPASPLSLGVDAVLPATPGEAYDHSRGISSTSTNALKRSYAGSVYSAGGGGGGQASERGATDMYLPPRRQSYLPHLPANRESIQIVPPQPLGFGLGGMAQATDEKTLAFSTVSGIGSEQDDFAKGLVWAEGGGSGGGGNDLGAASGSGAKVAHGDRARYLAEGPVRSWSGSAAGAAGASGWQSPNAPPSRSLSPAAAPSWDDKSSSHRAPGEMSASTSSSSRRASPSQSQARPRQHAHHPLADSSYSSNGAPLNDPLSTPTTHQNGAFASLQSPLQLMSDGANSGHGREASDADTLNTGPNSHENGGRGGSPIIGAFRSAETGRHPSGRANEVLPDLASGSASGSASHSSPTGPSTDSSGRPSAAEEEAPDRGERYAVGKDGVLRLAGPAVPQKSSNSNAARPENRRSWGFNNLLGRA